ncbi:MAG: polysaccharide pyruvyl transferase family protein [Synergistaceae bacterium]|nr:polysaccharide pyruvyl transferase family protein [Synergistaceae bacterium]MBR0034176.1 polysaccharide pyruvyl transferase family protein [Synergistaceae bacterium]
MPANISRKGLTDLNLPYIVEYSKAEQTTLVQKSGNRKVLLVTLYGNYNYGNILQRLALTSVIEPLGFEVTHLCIVTPPPKQPASRIIKTFIKNAIKRVLALLGVQKYRTQFRSMEMLPTIVPAFTKYQEQHIPSTSRIYMTFQESLSADSSEWTSYDYAVTGSDQVWHNWSRTPEELEYYYLSFMPPEKRVCYAPSFGFSEFPESYYAFHKKGLAGFERLSCREQEMIPMIQSISGKDAQLVLDPTLLLKASQWRAFASKPEYDVPERFVLCYFLGSKIPEYQSAIRQAAGDLPVINIYDPSDKKHWNTDPGGFLWLFDHADFVCTDSFHGTAFSVNFGKNFIVFRRKQTGMEDMFGRISGLLGSLDITGHICEHGMKVRPEPVNYDEVYAKLDALRESSMQYLRDCLK